MYERWQQQECFHSLYLCLWASESDNNRTIGSFLLIRKRNLHLGGESRSWECNEFTSWKVRELLVKTSPPWGKVRLTEDLIMDKPSLQVSQQIHQSSKSFGPNIIEELNLNWCEFFLLRECDPPSELVTNHILKTLHSTANSCFSPS